MSFQELWQSALQEPENCDFSELREAYVESEEYNPYGRRGAAANEMSRLIKSGSYKEAISMIERALESSPLDLELQMMAYDCYRKIGDRKKMYRTDSFLRGYIDTLMSTGDGKSRETAFRVVSMREEYALVSLMQMKVERQALLQDDDRSFDQFHCMSLDDGKSVTLYFDVTQMLNWSDSKFKL